MIGWVVTSLLCVLMLAITGWHLPILRAARQRRLAKGIGVAVEHRSPFLAGSADALEQLVAGVSVAMGLGSRERERVRIAAQICDLGLCGVPSELLLKNFEWSPEEQATFERHAAGGAGMLKGNRLLAEFAPIVRHHHSRFESEPNVPVESRIISACSDYLHLIRHVGSERALVALDRQSGFHYDPKVVVAIREVVSRGE